MNEEIKKAIEILKTECGCAELSISNRESNTHTEEFVFAVNIALKYLQIQLDQDSELEPLSLEELKQMTEITPVWIENLFEPKESGWDIREPSKYHDVGDRLNFWNIHYWNSAYSKTWLAYTQKPKKEHIFNDNTKIQ